MNITALSIGQDYCQPNTYDSNTERIFLTDTQIISAKNQLKNYSIHNLYTANAAGIIPLLLQLDSLKARHSTDLLGLKYQALLHIEQLNQDIDGLAATLDCEGEKTDQVANYLDKKNQKRNNQLTISSIIIGAMTTIATVAIQKNSVQNTVAIGGGLIGGGVAALMINPSGKKIQWPQKQNLLGAIWRVDNRQHLISPSLWYMLTQSTFSNSQKISLVESIKNRWKTINFQEDISAKDQEIFFGRGGILTADDLHLRANMLNELQATIRSLHQDLANLTNNIALSELTIK